MKICVLIQNEDWRKTAGVRIRYDRMARALAPLGHQLVLAAIEDFSAESHFDADLYVLSKIHDCRGLLMLQRIRRAGRKTAADFFDDYYSQSGDSRFVHLRRWFRQALPLLDLALCSTPNMQAQLTQLAPDLPSHVINDPFEAFDPDAIATAVARNAEEARQQRRIKIGWFGIGDNPHFSLGLNDLHGFSAQLSRCRRLGYTPELQILTNKRALTTDRLAMLARLPVPYQLSEWSEEAEQALIANSLLCFVPVNAQGFSVVKSLNRAITTLTGGAQLLSAGFPLYQRLQAFAYRDMDQLLQDLETDQLRLRGDRLPALDRLLNDLANPETEAARLLAFLSPQLTAQQGALPSSAAPIPPLTAVIHGAYSTGAVHKFAQRQEALSVGSLLSGQKLNYDVTPLGATEGPPAMRPDDPPQPALALRLSGRAKARLLPHWQDRLEPETLQGKPFFRLTLPLDCLEAAPSETAHPLAPLLAAPPRSTAETLIRYQSLIEAQRRLLYHLFGPLTCHLSETRSPFDHQPVLDTTQPLSGLSGLSDLSSLSNPATASDLSAGPDSRIP